MGEQLRDRYLADNACGHGLYLVGWFACPQWDDSDDQKGRTPKMTLEQAQQLFDEQASAISRQGPTIRAFVLNVALR
jgi:hypothetical protein